MAVSKVTKKVPTPFVSVESAGKTEVPPPPLNVPVICTEPVYPVATAPTAGLGRHDDREEDPRRNAAGVLIAKWSTALPVAVTLITLRFRIYPKPKR